MSHDLEAVLNRAGLCLGIKIRKAGPQPVLEEHTPDIAGPAAAHLRTVAPANAFF